jgi:hypothetical protein
MDAGAGLCETCAHARRIVSERASTFWLCRLAATDPRFPRYPRLPVVRCSGFAALAEPGETAADSRGDPA